MGQNEASDLEAFKAMLDRAGVVHKLNDDDPNVIVIEAQDGPKNEGYMGFVAVFSFNEDGRLESVGVWE